MAGPRTFAGILPAVTSQALGRRGMAFGSLFAEWISVVGDHLGSNTIPIRIVFPRGRREDAVLYLHAYSAVALEIQHLAPQMIERINSFFGYQAVGKLKVTQIHRLPGSHAPPRFRRLSASEIAAIEAATGKIPDQDLARTLTSFGITLTARVEERPPWAPPVPPAPASSDPANRTQTRERYWSLRPLEKPPWKLLG